MDYQTAKNFKNVNRTLKCLIHKINNCDCSSSGGNANYDKVTANSLQVGKNTIHIDTSSIYNSTGTIDFKGSRLTDIGTPKGTKDATNKDYVDNLFDKGINDMKGSENISISTDNIISLNQNLTSINSIYNSTGTIDFKGSRLTDIGTPKGTKDATNKDYVDNLIEEGVVKAEILTLKNIAGSIIYENNVNNVGIIENGCTVFKVDDNSSKGVLLSAAHCIDVINYETFTYNYKGYKGTALFPANNDEGYILVNTTIKYFYENLDVAVLDYSYSSTTKGTLPKGLKISTNSTTVGEELYVIGDAGALDTNSYTKVQVREPYWVPGPDWCSPEEGLHLVTTGPIYGGNSGSPFINSNNEVVGLLQCGMGEGFVTGSPSIVLNTLLNGNYPELPHITYYSDSYEYLNQYSNGINGFLCDNVEFKGAVHPVHYITRSYSNTIPGGKPFGPLHTQIYPPLDVYINYKSAKGSISVDISPTVLTYSDTNSVVYSDINMNYYYSNNNILNDTIDDIKGWVIPINSNLYLYYIDSNVIEYTDKVVLKGYFPKGESLPDYTIYDLYDTPIIVEIGFIPSPFGQSIYPYTTIVTKGTPWVSFINTNTQDYQFYEIKGISKGQFYSIECNRVGENIKGISTIEEFENNYTNININIGTSTINYIYKGEPDNYFKTFEIFNTYSYNDLLGTNDPNTGGYTFLTEYTSYNNTATIINTNKGNIKGTLHYKKQFADNLNENNSENESENENNMSIKFRHTINKNKYNKKKHTKTKKMSNILNKLKKKGLFNKNN
jgi:hypothetical protein